MIPGLARGYAAAGGKEKHTALRLSASAPHLSFRFVPRYSVEIDADDMSTLQEARSPGRRNTAMDASTLSRLWSARQVSRRILYGAIV